MISSFQHLAKFQAHREMEDNLEKLCIPCMFEKHTVFCLFLKTTSIGYGNYQHSFSFLWHTHSIWIIVQEVRYSPFFSYSSNSNLSIKQVPSTKKKLNSSQCFSQSKENTPLVVQEILHV